MFPKFNRKSLLKFVVFPFVKDNFSVLQINDREKRR